MTPDEQRRVDALSQSLLRDTIGSLVLDGIQQRARAQSLEAECEKLRQQIKQAAEGQSR